MDFELLSDSNKIALQNMFFEMWPEDGFDDHGVYVDEILHSQKLHAILARSSNGFAGFIYLSLRHDFVEGATNYPVAYVEGIYIRRPYRKKGLGKKLIELAELWGNSKGSKEIASDVEIDNLVSQKFHQHLGFKEENRIICYIKKLG